MTRTDRNIGEPHLSRDQVALLETYATRISQVYVTLRHKLIALGDFWRFLAEQHPDITSSADVLPAHGRASVTPPGIRQGERLRRSVTSVTWVGRICHF